MKILTPDQFEMAYRRQENKIYDWFGENVSWLVMALACIALYALTEFTNQYFESDRFDFFYVGAFVFVRLFRHGIWALLAISLIAPFVSRRYQTIYQFYSALTFALLTADTVYSGTDMVTYASGVLVVPLVLILSWFFLRANVDQQSRWKASAIYSLAFWALMAAGSYWVWRHYPEKLNRFWGLRPQFIWISMLVLVWQKKSPRTKQCTLSIR